MLIGIGLASTIPLATRRGVHVVGGVRGEVKRTAFFIGRIISPAIVNNIQLRSRGRCFSGAVTAGLGRVGERVLASW